MSQSIRAITIDGLLERRPVSNKKIFVQNWILTYDLIVTAYKKVKLFRQVYHEVLVPTVFGIFLPCEKGQKLNLDRVLEKNRDSGKAS